MLWRFSGHPCAAQRGVSTSPPSKMSPAKFIRWPEAQGWGPCCGRGSFVRCGRARSRSLPRPSHLSSTRGALAQLPPLARRDGALGGVRVHAPSSVARSTPAASRWRCARRASSAAPSSARSAARFACRSRSSSSSRAAAAAPCAARPKHVRRVRPGPHRSSARFSGRRSLRLRRSAHPCECRRRLRRPHRPRRSSACGLLVERCSNERRRRCVQERRRLGAVRGERPAVAVRGQRSSWYAARCSLRRLLRMRGGGSLEGGLLCSVFDTDGRTTLLYSVELGIHILANFLRTPIIFKD